MTKISKPEYLAKVALLTEEETERLLSRMVGKLPRRLEKGKLSQADALAIQMELENEQLQEWRKMMQVLKVKEETKKKEEAKKKEEIKKKEEVKAPSKAKVTAEAKTLSKPKATTKAEPGK